MDFQWALQQLKQGKKVFRETRRNGPDYIWSPASISIFDPDGQEYPLNFFDIEATDWQLYDDSSQHGVNGGSHESTSIPSNLGGVESNGSSADSTNLATELSVSPSLAAKIIKLAEKEAQQAKDRAEGWHPLPKSLTRKRKRRGKIGRPKGAKDLKPRKARSKR